MQDSSPSNYSSSRDFAMMLVILFLTESARSIHTLSYTSFLPTVTSIAIAITSFASSIYLIADVATNFVTGFLLKKFGSKLVLTSGFLLAFISLFSVIRFPASSFIIIFGAIMLGTAVSPIWVIMLSSVDERNRGKQMGYVYLLWLLGLLVGMVIMNLLIKFHPTRFTFLTALVVLIVWVLYYFVNINLTNYNTRPVKAQLKQIVDVAQCHLILFPGILLQGAAITVLVPILPKYATQVVKASAAEYTVAIIIGGIGYAFSMLFLSKIIDNNSKEFMHGIIFSGFILYTILIFGLSTTTNIYVVWVIGLFTGLMYGILLPAWNTFMAGHANPDEQEETWGVFNSVQGFGSMIGPLVGDLITQFTNNLNNTSYFSAMIFLALAVFCGYYFIKTNRRVKP